ncbi:hypothetical protein [Micromonospora sp. WMMD812]|uniref:hypothetical protein n=1 Tax=Micromonospora sp. WMMD812 TaxID=3015152 RepID=UPI00248CEA95|nr:hypothetical protein [Micromonospora sp. WMMD812]WBB68884.1 hypothetical protein O7603_05840 [Micromonospora sp. WMMD812]
MSIVEDVGAQVRAAAEELPLGLLGQALEKFGLASERLRWVRQESANPMGVPELSAATEHAETAGYALRLAQEQLSAYLATIGLGGGDGPPPARPESREPGHDAPRAAAPVAVPAEPAEQVRLRRWWSVRVAELTAGPEGADEPDERIGDSAELLRRVVRGVGAGDRDRLRTELRRAHADVGLGLAAIAPPLLRGLAGELLGHPPRAEDLGRLRGELDGRVRALLPGLPAPVLETLLTRVCRMPPPRRSGEPPHAADAAVTAGVLTGVLLARLGRDLPADAGRAASGGGAGTATGYGGRAATGDAGRAGRDADRARASGPDRTGGGEQPPATGPTGSGTGRTPPRWSGLASARQAAAAVGTDVRTLSGSPVAGRVPPRPGPWHDAPRRRDSHG